ncbi:MAG: pyruvate formate lyase family protein [Promethearchaeota archaeon]
MSNIEFQTGSCLSHSNLHIAEPHDLSSRARWLRDYYFKGLEREWNNEYMSFTTSIPNDVIWSEMDYYIVPEMYFYMGYKRNYGVYGQSIQNMATPVPLPSNFFDLPLPERRIIFFEKVMLDHVPQEIIGPDLICGARFNIQLSKCLDPNQIKKYFKKIIKTRQAVFKYHDNGCGNAGATAGHLIPDYKGVIEKGFQYYNNKIRERYEQLDDREKHGEKGAELRAMMRATEIPKKLAKKYADECRRLAKVEKNVKRREELEQMAKNCERVPWLPATTFWEAVQSLWLIHMLVMAEESYPGPGLSFGRVDQYLYDLYKKDVIVEKNITREFAKDILSCFWFHCNTVYDAQIRVGGKQGITSGFGQIITLSGLGPNGEDLTNELTYLFLEIIDEWSPILEPKPNVRLHRNSPDKLLDRLVNMISRSQGAPFILNFDERAMAGLIREGIPEKDVWDYAVVGCLENSMQGNDRSGTVNCNPNLVKSIELVLWNGKSKFIKGKPVKNPKQLGPRCGKPEKFKTWAQFWSAWKKQIQFLIKYTIEVYNLSEEIRGSYLSTPYLSSMVRGCIKRALDIRAGGPDIRFVTVEGVGFATLVDSLLAIKEFVYEEKRFTIRELKEAILADFKGSKKFMMMQALLKNRAPKFGNDDPEADELARKVMKIWSEETFKYSTPTSFRFRPGMLSWNYWAGEDAAYTPATPDGRNAGTFLSNAICPVNGADKKGPTAVANSVGRALGGKTPEGKHVNYLPNGASHTMTFNPSILRDSELKEKFKAFLRGYCENGGSALQINIIDAETLKDAQLYPKNYSNLLVRVTGYNAYFVAIGKELQDEIIAREMHRM